MTLMYAFVLTPLGLMHQLKMKTLVAAPLCLLGLAFQATLSQDTLYGEYNVGGVLCNTIVAVLLVAAFAVRQLNVYKELRDNLKERPWCTKETCAVSNDAIGQIECPFSGLGASMRCPNCYTCVSSPAYHFEDKLHNYGKQYVPRRAISTLPPSLPPSLPPPSPFGERI